jgi:hypothetical protein
MRTFVLSLAMSCLIVNAAIAGEACKAPAACGEVETCGSTHHCGRCGCNCCCEKHCQVVCETKEVKKTVWVVHCEDFCAPMPSCGHGCGCGEACEAGAAEAACCRSCDRCNPCARDENKRIVQPNCGKVREKKTLEKKEVICEVPSYKCVVVYCCPHCGTEPCDGQSTSPATPSPVKRSVPTPAPVRGKAAQDALLPPATESSFAN